MPDNQDGQGQNTSQNQKKPAQPAVKVTLEGALNKCSISVVAKPNVVVEFYAGNMNGNTLGWKVTNDAGVQFTLNTDNNGIALGSNVDFSSYARLQNYNCITAVAEGKQSAATLLPTESSPDLKNNKVRNLKILSPEGEVFLKHDSNRYPIEILSYVSPGVTGSRQIVLTSDGPITIYDRDNNVLATNVSRWEFSTDARGGHYHIIAPTGFTYREVKYRLEGEEGFVKKILEFR